MIKIAIVGTGGMANLHAQMLAKLPECKLTAACDVEAGRLQEFATKHGVPAVFTSVDELLERGDFEALINVTPDRFHAPISLQALRCGKHVLCEKPLSVNYPAAAEMAEVAAKSGVIHMVNFSYRNNSSIHKARELVSAGELGRILHVEASYLQSWLTQAAWGDWRSAPGWLWRLSTAHGSKGVLGDLGVHLLDFASYPTDEIASVHCVLKTFSKTPGDKVDDYVLDANDSAIITATLKNGALASMRTTRWATGHNNSITLAIYGDKGSLRIDLDRSGTQLELCRIESGKAGPWETIDCGATPSLHERFFEGIRTGVNDQPDFARGALIQKALDACELSHCEGRTISV